MASSCAYPGHLWDQATILTAYRQSIQRQRKTHRLTGQSFASQRSSPMQSWPYSMRQRRGSTVVAFLTKTSFESKGSTISRSTLSSLEPRLDGLCRSAFLIFGLQKRPMRVEEWIARCYGRRSFDVCEQTVRTDCPPEWHSCTFVMLLVTVDTVGIITHDQQPTFLISKMCLDATESERLLLLEDWDLHSAATSTPGPKDSLHSNERDVNTSVSNRFAMPSWLLLHLGTPSTWPEALCDHTHCSRTHYYSR